MLLGFVCLRISHYHVLFIHLLRYSEQSITIYCSRNNRAGLIL